MPYFLAENSSNKKRNVRFTNVAIYSPPLSLGIPFECVIRFHGKVRLICTAYISLSATKEKGSIILLKTLKNEM